MEKQQSPQYDLPILNNFGCKLTKLDIPKDIAKPGFIEEVSVHALESDKCFIAACHFDVHHFVLDEATSSILEGFPEILRSVPKRQAEFAAGRFCANLAAWYLSPTSSFPFKLPIGQYREPLWPAPFAGSISHNNTNALAMVYRKAHHQTRGIDIEDILASDTAQEIDDQIHTPEEYQHLRRGGFSKELATTIIYSAKESIFKSLFPLVGEYFGFKDAKLVAFVDNQLIFKMNTAKSLFVPFRDEVRCKFTVDANTVITICQYPSTP